MITKGDTPSNTTINIMLDHNTTKHVVWVSKEDYLAAGGTENVNNNKGPLTANKQLQTDVATWNNSIKSTVRLISGQEVADIVGNTDRTAGGDIYHYQHNLGYTKI